MSLPSHRHKRQGRLSAAVLFLAAPFVPLVLVGCGGGGKSPTQAVQSRSTSLALSLTWPDLSAKTAGRAFPVAANSLTITVRDSSGFTDTRTLVRPSAGSPTTVTATFDALASGQATIVASAFASTDATGPPLSQASDSVNLQNNRQASANLVFPSPIAVIALSPASLPLARGGTAKLTALAADDRDVLLTPVGTWASSDSSVATVDASGNVTAVGGGTAAIIFTDSVFGKTGQAAVTIRDITFIVLSPQNPTLLPGATLTFSASGQDDAGVVQNNPAGVWVSSNPVVATVDAAGNVTALRGGTTTISFTDAAFGITGSTTATVRGITQIALSPANQVIAPGATLALSAVGSDANGLVQSSPPGVWASSDATVATVSAAGVVTAIKPGSVQITFTDSVYGVTAATNVRVRGGDAEVIVQ